MSAVVDHGLRLAMCEGPSVLHCAGRVKKGAHSTEAAIGLTLAARCDEPFVVDPRAERPRGTPPGSSLARPCFPSGTGQPHVTTANFPWDLFTGAVSTLPFPLLS